MRTELLNVQPVINSLKLYNKEHKNIVKKTIAKFMTQTRLKASDYVIPNKLPTYKERRRTPSTPGRLTTRTGRLVYMLRHHAHRGNLLANWGNTWDNILQKEDSVALKGQIREMRMIKDLAYTGTYRVYVQDHPTLTGRLKGMPRDNPKTLAMRFSWEVRGRPIFSPVVDLSELDFRRMMREGIETVKLK